MEKEGNSGLVQCNREEEHSRMVLYEQAAFQQPRIKGQGIDASDGHRCPAWTSRPNGLHGIDATGAASIPWGYQAPGA